MNFTQHIAVLGIVILGIPSAAPCQEKPSSGRGVVGVTVTKQRRMLVETWVNGARGTFLVDTGAGDSYMGEKFAGSLHLRRVEGGYSYNVLGPMPFDVTGVGSLELGANRVPLRHGLMHISNLGWTNKGGANPGNANPIHGLIGGDILLRNQAVIDCGRRQLLFGGSVGVGASRGHAAVRFLPRRGDEIAVAARVNGVEGIFIVDTGYNVSLLSPEFAVRLGGTGSRVVNITALEIGFNRLPARLDRMIITRGVSVANQGYMELGESPYDGVLGMDFLLGNHAVIDCRQRLLLVE